MSTTQLLWQVGGALGLSSSHPFVPGFLRASSTLIESAKSKYVGLVTRITFASFLDFPASMHREMCNYRTTRSRLSSERFSCSFRSMVMSRSCGQTIFIIDGAQYLFQHTGRIKPNHFGQSKILGDVMVPLNRISSLFRLTLEI